MPRDSGIPTLAPLSDSPLPASPRKIASSGETPAANKFTARNRIAKSKKTAQQLEIEKFQGASRTFRHNFRQKFKKTHARAIAELSDTDTVIFENNFDDWSHRAAVDEQWSKQKHWAQKAMNKFEHLKGTWSGPEEFYKSTKSIESELASMAVRINKRSKALMKNLETQRWEAIQAFWDRTQASAEKIFRRLGYCSLLFAILLSSQSCFKRYLCAVLRVKSFAHVVQYYKSIGGNVGFLNLKIHRIDIAKSLYERYPRSLTETLFECDHTGLPIIPFYKWFSAQERFIMSLIAKTQYAGSYLSGMWHLAEEGNYLPLPGPYSDKSISDYAYEMGFEHVKEGEMKDMVEWLFFARKNLGPPHMWERIELFDGTQDSVMPH